MKAKTWIFIGVIVVALVIMFGGKLKDMFGSTVENIVVGGAKYR
jgi:hypothetical protein